MTTPTHRGGVPEDARSAREVVASRVPYPTSVALKRLAQARGVTTSALASTYIEECLARDLGGGLPPAAVDHDWKFDLRTSAYSCSACGHVRGPSAPRACHPAPQGGAA